MRFIIKAWVRALDAIGRLDHKLTGAYYRPSTFGLILMLLVTILFLPFAPLMRSRVREVNKPLKPRTPWHKSRV